ncbi:MAG: hypothetical protein AAGB35_08430 [Pseudomonadota bacterium]
MNNNNKSLLILIFVSLQTTPIIFASDNSSTEIAIYGLAVNIKGDTQVGDVETDIDVPFSDILDNLDFGAMLAIEHQRGNWSVLGDVLYMDLSVDNTATTDGSITLDIDASVKQLVLEGFVTYRFLQREIENSSLSLDVLLGLRYIDLDLDVGVDATFNMGSASRSGSIDEDWLDGVIGLRAKYNHNSGWGAMFWIDVGEGKDSSSYQLIGMANYKFENDVKVFGGYRFLHTEYEDGSGASFFEFDADYSGPQIGVSKTF